MNDLDAVFVGEVGGVRIMVSNKVPRDGAVLMQHPRCRACGGSGRRVFRSWMGDMMDRTCPKCDGSGAG